VLSGNRNFEGRVSPDVRANFLASPPLVVAYALKGTVRDDFTTTPIGSAPNGKPVMLKDIWPTNQEVSDMISSVIDRDMFPHALCQCVRGRRKWRAIDDRRLGHLWLECAGSTYVQNPPYFRRHEHDPGRGRGHHRCAPLAILGDSITTDHISPAGSIKVDSPAGRYLNEHQVSRGDFNSLRRAPRQP
jgi:aconitate hydratase